MATQVYRCPVHGEWDHQQPLTASVAPVLACPHVRILEAAAKEEADVASLMADADLPLLCGESSKHVLKPPFIRVKGGTTPAR